MSPKRNRPEKTEEAAGDRLMGALGWKSWHLSQARATHQTPGWPDRLYTYKALGLAWWWEAKAEGGRQSRAQKEFQEAVEAAGQVYILGTIDRLIERLEFHGFGKRTAAGGFLVYRNSEVFGLGSHEALASAG